MAWLGTLPPGRRGGSAAALRLLVLLAAALPLVRAATVSPVAGPASGGTILTASLLPLECSEPHCFFGPHNASSLNRSGISALVEVAGGEASAWSCEAPAALDAGAAAVTEWRMARDTVRRRLPSASCNQWRWARTEEGASLVRRTLHANAAWRRFLVEEVD